MALPEKSSVGGRAARAERNIVHHQFAQVQDGAPANVRTSPHSVEAEEALIACCLIDAGASLAQLQVRQIQPAAFYEPALRTLYEVMLDIAKAGQPLDLVVLAEELRRRNLLDAIGGLVRLNEITNRVPTTAHFTYFLQEVRDSWVMRELIARATARMEACYQWQGGNVREFILGEQAKLAKVADFVQEDTLSMAERAQRAEARMRSIADGTVDKSRLVYTGLKRFDDVCTPIDINNDDTFILIGALAGFGKSSLLRAIALNNAMDGRRVLYHLLEGSLEQLVNLMAASLSRVSLTHFDRNFPDHQKRFFEAHRKVQGLLGKTLFVVDDVRSIGGIESSTRELMRKHGQFEVKGVDYAQLVEADVRSKSFNREQEVAQVAKRLAALGKDTRCPVAAAAQIDKGVQLENRRPVQADLRESAVLAHAARRVIMVHVPKQDCRGTDQTDAQSRVMVELLQVKNNNGPKGAVRAWFDRPWTLFSDGTAEEQDMQAKPAGEEKSYQKKKQ